jgi:hypothetical protein
MLSISARAPLEVVHETTYFVVAHAAMSVSLLLVTYSHTTEKAHADQTGCTLDTIKATYAIHSEGQFLGPGPFPVGPIGEAGMVTLDGKGHLAGQSTLNISGQSFPTSFTGTYTVNSDCTTIFVVQTGFGTLNLSGVIVGRTGKEIVQVSTDPMSVLTSDLKRF